MKLSRTFLYRTVATLGLAGALAACQTQPVAEQTPWLTGYTCCNLHYDGDWISDANYADLPFIPAGTPVSVAQPGRDSNRAYATIGGRPFRLGLDYGRAIQGTEQWLSTIIVREDPRINNAAWALEVRQAIAQSKVLIGMTKEQAIVALGYPLPTRTPNLDSSVWRYWQNSSVQYDVYWENERVSQVAKASESKGGLPVVVPSHLRELVPSKSLK
jgi:hypothetical protein